jgi:hypothetical protein
MLFTIVITPSAIRKTKGARPTRRLARITIADKRVRMTGGQGGSPATWTCDPAGWQVNIDVLSVGCRKFEAMRTHCSAGTLNWERAPYPERQQP